ncbi:MAG: SDR family oxidoreductase [candidate division NC10 bacterium]|nr:SDR family oxidoreductase [candidate division NC10 bacterium]MCZ6551622.1 SDR family oxidoreductase [candidate division NC10 bacterium]
MILVVGGTGRVGSQVVQQLRRQGRPVRALCRSESKAKPLREAGVEIALGDLADRRAIETACRGVGTIISTMTSLNPRTLRDRYHPEVIEEQGHRNLLDVARQAGVNQVIYLSAIGVEHPQAPRQFRVKRLVEKVVKSSGLPYTILRPSGFMENLLPVLPAIQRFRVAPLPGTGTAPITYIAVEDIARVAVQAVGHPEAQGAMIEYGGPEDLSNRQCVQIAAKVLGTSAWIAPIPLTLFHLIGGIARPVSPGLREFFAILRFVDRYGLCAPHHPPFSNEPWTPLTFEEFVRRHIR